MNGAGLDFQCVARAALAAAPALLSEWLPGGRIQGDEYTALNPTRADRRPGSFRVNLRSGAWADFATSDRGGDMVSLAAYLQGRGQAEAARALAERLTVDGHAPSREEPAWAPVAPIPDDAGEPPAHPTLGRPSRTWAYRDAEGRRLALACRFDGPQGKRVLPLTFCQASDGRRAWRWQGLPAPRPLYSLDLLATRPEAPVLVVEGEKTADAAQDIFKDYVVVTSPNGARSAGQADWRPLAGRRVVVWPDADEPGAAYARDVARLALAAGAASVRVVALPSGLPAGWDVADEPPAGWAPERLRGLLSAAAQPMEAEAPASGRTCDEAAWPTPVPFERYDAPPLPVESLPRWARDFVLAAAEHLQVAPCLVMANVLGAVATACARKLVIEVKPGYAEPLNLYILAPAPPAERKTATQAAALAPLYAWEAVQAEAMRDTIVAAASRRKSQEAVIAGLRSRLGKAKPEARESLMTEIAGLEAALEEAPKAPRVLADDITPEATAALMAGHDERLGIASCEGGLFDTLAGRYNSGIPNLDLVLKSHAGEPARVDRKGGPPVLMANPALTLVLSPQPEVMAGLMGKPGFRGRGLLGRFAYVLPQSRLGRRAVDAPPIPEAVRRAYADGLGRLLDLPWAGDENGAPMAHVLRLAPAAYRAWAAFAQAVEPELAEGGRFETLRDWAGKLPGLAARLGGLLHCMEHLDRAPGQPVGEPTMAKALDLAAALTGHALAAFGLMGADPDLEAARYCLAWLCRERPEHFTTRDAHRALRGHYPRAEQVRAALAVLEERGFLVAAPSARDSGPGRPASPAYLVNPACWEVR